MTSSMTVQAALAVKSKGVRVTDASMFGRVAVLYGGLSAEREVSLMSGAAVHDGLMSAGVDAHLLDVGTDVLKVLGSERFDRVFNILHGRGGEDGTVQGALALLGLPCTGSGVLGSALAMDKHRTKLIWQACGLPVSPSVCLRDESDLFTVAQSVGYPLAIKPVHEGSSIGITKVADEEALHTAWWSAGEFDDDIMVERWIEGDEYTIGIVDREVLPVIKLETPRTFYDYEAKYADNSETQYLCPCGLPEEREMAMRALALQAFDAVGASSWGRVDLMTDDNGVYLLEVNTNPGMTSHSLVPMAAQQAGMTFAQLVWRILETTLD